MSRRKKIKKLMSIIFIFIIIISLLVIYISNNFKDTKKEIKKEEIKTIDLVYNKLKNNNIDKSFLEWIDNNYKDSINKLNDILSKEEYDISIWHEVTGYSYIVLNDLYNKKYDSMNNIKIIKSNNPSTLSFVGDISLADNWRIMPKYDERGQGVKGILSEDVLDIMTKSDLMVANSEFTVSNRGTPMANKLYTFRAKPERLSIYFDMGVDLVTLANNHTYDFGKDAFLDMLDAFDEYKIPHIGAGHNIEEAQKPYYFIINGYKIGFLNGTRAEKYIMTPEATDTSEGVFRCYDPTNMINQIKKIREESDYIIVIMHFGKEGYHELEKEQVESSKQYIDAGADVIVGHHAHTLQGIEIYNNKPIIYNLGDFIFNSETEETAIFQIILKDDGTMDYYIIPALQQNEYTDLLRDDKKQKLINDINSWSINTKIDQNGKINQS